MGHLVLNIKSIKDFFYIQGKFKDIPQFVNTELKFYFLTLDKGNYLKDIFDYIHLSNKKYDFSYEQIEETENELLFYVKVIKHIGVKEIFLDTCVYLDKDRMNLTLMTDDEKEKLNILEEFIRKMFPFANKKFIKSKEIVEIINDFLEDGYFISSSMVSSKRWWEKVQRIGIDYPIDVPIEEVLADLNTKNAFINSIVLNIFDKDKTNRVMKLYISRRGFIKFSEGYFDLFEGKILTKLLSDNFNEKKMLENRQRVNEEIKPLRLSFERLKEFEPIEITKHFAEAVVSQARDFSFAVFHSGNPYFHASVTDLYDGSVFTVVFHNTKENSELIIIPQYATSSNSLSKFISIVYSEFGEGEVGNYLLEGA